MAKQAMSGERVADRNARNDQDALSVRIIQSAQTVPVNGTATQIKGFQDSDTLTWTVTPDGYLKGNVVK